MTDRAWAYLNIDRPLVAWNVYRGVLLSPPNERGSLSVWCAGTLASDRAGRRASELRLEQYRSLHFPERISRLRGLYCFLTLEDAERAGHEWGPPFTIDRLVELDLQEVGTRRDTIDSNWISYSPRNQNDAYVDESWFADYWAGKAFPGKEPIWETLVDGRLSICGNELRARAYTNLRRAFPKSLGFLEQGRLAALIGSDYGNISAFLLQTEAVLSIRFYMDQRDDKNPDFIPRLIQLHKERHSVNVADLAPFPDGSLPQAPNLTPIILDLPTIGSME